MVGQRDPSEWGGNPWESDRQAAISRAFEEPSDDRFAVMDGIEEWRESIRKTQEAWYERPSMSDSVRPEENQGA